MAKMKRTTKGYSDIWILDNSITVYTSQHQQVPGIRWYNLQELMFEGNLCLIS
jgi:hypothetical protein